VGNIDKGYITIDPKDHPLHGTDIPVDTAEIREQSDNSLFFHSTLPVYHGPSSEIDPETEGNAEPGVIGSVPPA
jgi:hypothetical protein